jgi:hypothetical protein
LRWWGDTPLHIVKTKKAKYMDTDLKNHENPTGANNVLAAGIRECLPDKHKRRDNKFGVTWCVKCGQLFTKPSGIPLQESDKVVYACR